jgi:hypothetical protein
VSIPDAASPPIDSGIDADNADADEEDDDGGDEDEVTTTLETLPAAGWHPVHVATPPARHPATPPHKGEPPRKRKKKKRH